MDDRELEKAILSHIIFREYECDLIESDFVDGNNKVIIKVINELKRKKEEISMISVKSKIKGDGQRIIEYLSSLVDYAVGTEADDLYNRLIELSQKRAIFNLLQEKRMMFQNDSVQEISSSIIKEINNIMQRNQKELTFFEQINKTAEDIENKYKNRNDVSLYTGIQDLDNKILGLHNGELTIIGARPRCRKNNASITNRRENS